MSRPVLAALTASAVLLFLAAPAGAKAPPLATGITGISDYNPSTMQAAADAGARFVRVSLGWGGIAPKKPPAGWNPEDPADPHYNWKQTDADISTVVAAGLTPVLEVDGVPAWAQGCVSPSSSGVCSPDPAAYRAFAVAAARRYSGSFNGLPRVRYWQGLNEPNLTLFFYPQFEGRRDVSPALYRVLANAFYAAITSVDPSNLVLLGGLGPVEYPHLNIGPMRFTRELLCMRGGEKPRPLPGKCEGGVHFDIFDIHPYTSGAPSHGGGGDNAELGDLPRLQRLLRAADRAGRIKGRFSKRSLWITEFGWDSNPPDPGGVKMSLLVNWTEEALYRAWRVGVSHFFWYRICDQSEGKAYRLTVQSGLYFCDGGEKTESPKPVREAFRFPFVASPSRAGLNYWGRTPTSRGGKVRLQVLEGGRWRTAAVVHARANGIFTGTARTDYGRNRHGKARAIYRGEVAPPFPMKPLRDFFQPPFG